MSAAPAAATAGSGPAPAPTVQADHALLITGRLPLFALLWLTIVAAWSASHVVRAALDLRGAAVNLGLITGVLLGAIVASRSRPLAAHVHTIALVTCVVLTAAAAALLAYQGGYGEVLVFSQLLLCLASSLMFAWGWGTAVVLMLASFASAWVAEPWLQRFLPTGELLVGFGAGWLVWIALAETSARSFRTLWQQRATERATRAELEASRDAYRDLAETARDHIWVADLEGRITYTNEASARYHRAPVAALVGETIFDTITDHPRNPDARDVLARTTRGETLPPLMFQVRPRSGDPDIQWHEVLLSTVRDGEGRVIGVRGISRDVSQRVRTEERLRESEERFRTAFAATSVGLSITNAAGRAVLVNDAVCAMLGYAREELMEMTIDSVTHPDDRELTRAERQRLITGERSTFTLEKRFIRRDGQVVWGLVNVSSLRDAHGTPVAFIALVQDVTERRLADEALRRSHAELGQSRERLRRLARQQTAIREEERKRLGLDLHDDVCQELLGMTIMLESLRQRLEPLPAPEEAQLARIVEVARDLGEHLRLVAHDLRPAQLGDLGLEGSLRSLASALSSEDCRIEVRFPTAVPRLHEETEVGVYRIAQEALGNALRHARATRIDVSLAVEADEVRLEVRDDGRGFVADGGGEGLGLFSMEERALALGGRVRVSAKPGAGTALHLRCPVRDRVPAETAA